MSFQPYQQPGAGQPYGSMGKQSMTPTTSGKAIASLILGLLSVLFSCLTGLPAIILGILAFSDVKRGGGQIKGSGLAIVGIVLAIFLPLIQTIALLLVLLLPAVGAARNAARQAQSANELRQVGLGFHNLHDANRKFPMVGTDPETVAGLSWRVQMLPYLEEGALYGQFDLESGWESETNRPLAARRPATYAPPMVPVGPEGTSILAVTGEPDGEIQYGISGGAKFSDITDGTSNTAMAVLSDGMVMSQPWTSGNDLVVNPSDPSRGLFRNATGNYTILMADGSVIQVDASIDPQTLLHVMQRNDGNVVMLP